ncbi:MAG: ribosome biogenesis/translation initiation ATPase RLI [Nanoarchaeota archaeon]|nr:ribosome biogenesis/translation initiation ATPase RLI [Nanoarchaeota archaeon]
MRIAVIDKDKCNRNKCSFECNTFCPPVRSGKEDTVVLDESNKSVIDEVLCIGCGICVKRCPFKAIEVVNLPEMKGSPIHKYGSNGFRVFNFPTPSKGKVVGLIGPNGIGKTTILKILTNQIKPNLGGENASDKEIINGFKGTETQKYFTELYSSILKISFKPQYVDDIPKVFKGKVRALLKKAGDECRLSDVCEKLGISNVLNSDVSELSGGELQKVAIAATLVKNADYYFFDEPMSYLDVNERLKVSNIIKELSENGKGVVVIEHDLISLDYLIDSLHILYGKKSVYGIVSKQIKAKNGINSYLKGFLREENVRFRNSEIKFAQRKALKKQFGNSVIEWGELEKNYSKFKLLINPGKIRAEEVIGVVGPNATGKTTFMNILAGKIKASKNGLNSKLKISYKPQYLTQSEETVFDFLKKNCDTASDEFLTARRKLGFDSIMEKKVSELSGGELQIINITACIAREEDIYLLDEPSAYLDVEQRVNISRLVQSVLKLNGKTVVIIDHDLLFITYVSDSIIVFSGEPSVGGVSNGPFSVDDGMNNFLKGLKITFRKDPETNRPRANKLGSVKDKEQKRKGDYFVL